jgi:hypothetical protein
MHVWPMVWWMVCVAMHTRAQYTTGVIGKRHYATTSSQPLHDYFHARYRRPNPKLVLAASMFNEALLPGSVAFLFWTCGFTVTLPLTAFVHSWLLLFRSACFSTTLLPDASQTFDYQDSYTFKGGIHCLVFSGHTTTTLMCTTIWAMVTHPPALAILFAYGICGLQSLGILYCRKHYTVDVLLAWIIVPLWTFALTTIISNHLK